MENFKKIYHLPIKNVTDKSVMEMETAAFYKFMSQNNSRLPLKKRFSSLLSYNADCKEKKVNTCLNEWKVNPYHKDLKLDSYHKQLKMDSYRLPTLDLKSRVKKLKVETRDVGVNENIDTNDEYDFLSESDTEDEIPMEVLKKKMKPGMVPIGDGHAYVPATLLLNMDWSSYTLVTRKLLLAVFPRSILATHSLSGKRSPAFPHLPPKKRLPIGMVNDIVQTVVERCGVSVNLVRIFPSDLKLLRFASAFNDVKCDT
ncbi:hypothetical protein ABMA27_005080 [Loxostege sticticalis]|uniref:BEN domain-containing protein n=1 Tax=Loxostege sticticalis TaxID=481309 RepID=A0ABR3HLR5_LOXSC